MASTGLSTFYAKSDFEKVIVCFLFDGSPKYTRMTLNAVNSFIANTPHVPVGLLFPKGLADKQAILSEVRDTSRVHTRDIETHFQNWNPTQHKLDIAKFSDQFDTIFWLDSDAVVYKDLSDLLHEFHTSPCKVAFLKDHVCYNPQFLAVWHDYRKVKEPFVPQACFMGFKKEVIPHFFGRWKETWRTWIEPAPFANHPNPLPNFAGSAFCTEQYALGMVLEEVKVEEIYVIRRITFPLRGIPTNGAAVINQDAPSSIDWELAKSKLEKDYSEEELKLLEQKFRQRLLVTPGTGAGANTSAGISAYRFSGSAFEFSGPASSAALASLTNIPTSAWQTSYVFAEQGQVSYSGYLPGLSSGFSYSGLSFSGADFSGLSFSGSAGSSASGTWIPVDNIAGGIVHFYSMFYDASYQWWQANKEDVIPRLGDYWKNE